LAILPVSKVMGVWPTLAVMVVWDMGISGFGVDEGFRVPLSLYTIDEMMEGIR